MKITILKNYRDKETLRNVEIEALVQMIAERMAEERDKQLELEAKEKEAKEQESKN